MIPRLRRASPYVALVLLFLLHLDLWLWHEAGPVLGLPAGLAYHVLYCFVTALVFAAVVRLAWPLPGGDEPTRR